MGRVWDGPPYPIFIPIIYIFFLIPIPKPGGTSWYPMPIYKRVDNLIPSQICFWELYFYRTWVSEISINTIWVIIFKLQITSFKIIHTPTTLILCCLLIHI